MTDVADAHVVVIGGGISGLAAVERLTRNNASLRVTLLEASTRLGGHIRTEHEDGFIMEAGPDVLLAAKPAAVDLAQRVGLGERLRGTSARVRGSYVSTARGLVRMPDGMTGLVPGRAMPFVRTPLLSPAGKLRVAMEYFIPPWRSDSDESVESFVVRRLGRQMYDRLAEPLLSGISAGDGARLSMATLFPQLRGLEREHGGLLRGMLATRRRQKGAPSPAPGPRSPFLSFPGGLSELVEATVGTIEGRDPDARRISLRTGAAVTAIARDRTTSAFTIELANGDALHAHDVIIAAPAFVAATLLQHVDRELARRLAAIEYESTITVSLAYPDAAVPRALDATGYVVPRKAGREVLACTWASAKFDGRAPAGHALFRVFLGGAGRKTSVTACDHELREVALREMREVMGIVAEPELVRINRFERAMPQYHVDHLTRVAGIHSHAAQIPGLHLAGAAYGGVGIPDCVRSGDLAAGAVLRRLDTRSPSLIPSLA